MQMLTSFYFNTQQLFMKKIYFLLLTILSLAVTSINAQNVTVNPGAGSYPTLKAAFDAINAGTHTGAITVAIGISTVEGTTPATLNSSGAGAASYTSVIIFPSADGVSVSGNPVTGFGVIQLKGADNVTIDGDNPNTGGTNRNLTVNNTTTTTVIANSVIRIATAANVTSADNITIRNCILNGNVTSGNASGITSTTGSSNSSFGIYCGGNGGATATDAPTAITSSFTSNTAPSGTTINNLTIDNNTINQCARAIVFNGAVATVAPGTTTITNNIIGDQAGSPSGTPPYTTPATTVYTKGIWMNGLTAGTVTGNTIKNILSYVGTTITAIETAGAIGGAMNISNNTITNIVNNASSACNGIQLASATTTYTLSGNIITNIRATGSSCSGITSSTTATSATISLNKITTVRSHSTGGWRACGITIAAGNAVTIQNNFIAEVLNIGSGSFDNSFNANGILLAAGINHKVYHNTVNLFGVSTSVGSNSINCLAITASTQTGIDVRNNIFSNTVTGGVATDVHTCVFLPFTASASMLLNLNNNAYYTGTIAGKSGIGFGGATSYAAANVYNVANFIPGSRTPATNWRSFSSALGVTASDDGSFGFTTAAPFTSSTDLHINIGVTPTQLESGGASVGVATDIDGHVRPGPAGSVNGGAIAPDLGADEFDGVILDIAPPVISYTPLPFTCVTGARTLTAAITDISGVPTSGLGLPVLYWRINAGAYTAATGTHTGGNNYNFTFGAGAVLGDVVSYYIVAQDNVATPNVEASPAAGAGGFTANPPAAATPPTTPSSYSISGSLSGTFTVGVGGNYTTLTAAAAAYNSSCLGGAVIFNLIDATYPSETFPITINQNPDASAVNTLTIKPATGVTATISGSATTALIKDLGSYVTVDGSNNGSTSRDLTITNTSVTTPSVYLIGSTGTTPVVGSGIKNTVIINGVNTSSAVVVTDGTTLGSPGYFNNITIQNNSIQRAYMGLYCNAVVLAGNGSGLNITSNEVNTSGANAIRICGLYVQGTDGATISQNTVGNFENTSAENKIGIWMDTGTGNTTVTGNTVSTLGYTGTSGNGPYGIRESSGLAASGNNINGNTISNISTSGSATVYGISNSGGGTIIQKNNVSNIKNNNTGTYGVRGIDVSTGNNVIVRNNFVSDVNHDMTGGGAFSTTFGVYGIRIGAGTGHKVYHNSVNLFGLMPGTPATSLLSAAFALVSTASTGCDVRNNIFANNITGGTTSIANVSAYLPSGGTAAMNLIWNNNAYYFGTDAARQGVGQAGTTAGTNFYTSLAALTAYSNTLGTATNDNRSFAGTSAVPFVSGSDLHITGADCPLNGTGAALGVVDDIDANSRNLLTPDLGADEFTGATEPTITLGANPAACVGAANANLTYSATTNSPDQYSIDFDAAAEAQGFVDVVNAPLPASPIVITITGAIPGTYNALLRVTNSVTGCLSNNYAITVTINPNNTITLTSAPGTDAQSVCINTPITDITYATTTATGATFSGLPAGVTGNWSANVVTISGTPTTTVGSPFNYTVTLTGGGSCGTLTATGTITVIPDNTITLTSAPGTDAQAVCINTAITNITYATTTATGATFSGLPTGVTGSWAANVVTISGTPTTTVGSPFSYTVTLTGGCGTVTATGTITVRPLPVIASTQVEPTTCASADGSITLTLSGAAGPYTFAWTGSGVNPTSQNQTGLTVGAYSVIVTAANGCTATANFALAGPGGCSICPTIPTFATTPSGAACSGSNVTLTASGLTSMGSTYGILFKYSTTVLANPYIGGTVIATVANGALTSGGTVATANSASIPVGNYYVYAVLTPTPVDPLCRPSALTNLTINPLPTVNTVANQIVCNGASTAAVSFTGSVPGTVYNWTNDNASIGLAASGTGDIGAFTAINTGAIPVVATVTVTPSTVASPGGYNYSPIVFAPLSTVGTSVSLSDDQVSGALPLGFNFDFYGNTYNQFYISSNGFITFDPTSNNGCCSGQLLPNASNPNDLIAAAWTDLFPPGGGTITYNTTGVSPNRRTAISYNNMPFFPNSIPEVNTQIILYEATNIIEIHTANVVPSGRTITQGVENSTGTLATETPGRNASNWSITNDAVRFTPAVSSPSCTGTPITYTYTVNPTPIATATPSSQTVCSGTAIAPIALTSTVVGTTYAWTRDNTVAVTGIAASGTGNSIAGTLTNTTALPVTVTFTIIPTANGCAGPAITATVLVNPIPNAIATPAAQTICNGVAITPIVLTSGTPGTTFTWTRNNTTSTTAPGGIPASGSGNTITGFMINTTFAPITVTFTITPTFAGCVGTPVTATVTIQPTPTAAATPATQVSCSGAPIATINLTGLVAGTVYNWTRDNVVAATGIAASGTGNISGTLTTTVNTPVVVTFTITPSINGCNGPSIIAIDTIYPTPSVNQPVNQVVCNGGATSAVTFTGTVAGTTFNWTNTTPSIGLAATGTGNIPVFTAVNTTNAPVTATITVTPVVTSTGCVGVAKTFTITVNPTATVGVVPNQTLCTGSSTAAINFTSTVAGTTFSWTNNTPSIGLASSGTGNIPSFTAINITPTAVTATITVTPNTAAGCIGVATTVTITVNGNSVAPTGATSSVVANCGPTSTTLTVVGGALGTGASWRWYSASCGGTLVGTGASITIPVNTTTTYFVRAEGTCNTTGCGTSVTVTINTIPTISIAAAPFTALTPLLRTNLTATVNPTAVGNVVEWFKDNGPLPIATGLTLTNINVDQLGSYRARVTTAQGCTATSNTIEIRDSATGQLFVYQNPNNGKFQIRYYLPENSISVVRKVAIFDSKGALVYNQRLSVQTRWGSVNINILGVAQGSYFIKILDVNDQPVVGARVQVLR